MRPLLLPAIVAVVVAFVSPDARAYPWLINHGYSKCAACHVDPSGGGQVSAYGRALQDQAVRWHADPKEIESGEVSPLSGSLWGLVEQPEWLNVSGNLRGGGMAAGNAAAVDKTALFPLLMAADLTATVTLSSVVAHAAVGYGYRAQSPLVGPGVAFAPGDGDHAIMAREYWVGVRLLDDAMMIRAGRMGVPFGLRNNEHTSWVRQSTRSDINVGQQTGLAVAWQNDLFRTEVMGLAGNYQVRPDAYRERGYAGFLEYTVNEHAAVGVSSRLTWAANDLTTQTPATSLRNEHGLFGRWAPMEWLTLLGEGDALVATLGDTTSIGGVGWLQVDVMPVQGIHIMPAVETLYVGSGNEAAPAIGGWLSAAWYAFPHVELRFDNIVRQTSLKDTPTSPSFASLLQLHVFL